MMFSLLETAHEGGISPWWVGGVFLVAMLVALMFIINYGKGRPHA